MTTHSTKRRDFPTTRWSVVMAARQAPSPASAVALEAICRSYWYPLYSYARHSGNSAHDAQDITQGFFCRLLEKGWLEAADQEKGRLRTFLIVAFKHYMHNQWRHQTAQRRGGQATHIPIDAELAESRFAADASTTDAAELAYDRQWALTLLELTLKRLDAEFRDAGKEAHYRLLKPSLMAAHGSLGYPALAAQLQTTEAATRVAVHRLRKRFRHLYREEVAQTLPAGCDLKSEIHYLARTLASSE